MEIKDLKPNQGNIDVVVTVVSKEKPRNFEKFGKTGKVCTALVKDASGQVKLTLWNQEAENINVGDKLHVQNGWCSEFKGEKQLSAGKFGKIEVVESTKETVFTNDPGMLNEKDAAGTDEENSEEEESAEEFIGE